MDGAVFPPCSLAWGQTLIRVMAPFSKRTYANKFGKLSSAHRTGETETLWGHKENFVCTRTQEKGAITSQETEPDLPMSVWESPAEVWVDSALLWGQGHWLQQSCNLCWLKSFGGGCLYPYNSLALCQTTGREHSSTHQQKIGLKTY